MTCPPADGSHGRGPAAWFRLGLLALALVAAGWLLWLLVEAAAARLSLPSIRAWLESAGLWAPAASVGLMVVHTFVPFPAEFLAGANGLVFGAVRGTLITWLGGLAGAASGYAVGALLKRWLLRRSDYAKLLDRARHLVEGHGTVGLLLVRLLPVVSFNLVDYAAGALRLSWWQFGWTTAVGILPWAALMTVGGTQVLPALRGEPVALALLAAVAALLGAVTWAAHRRYGRKAAAGSRWSTPRPVGGPPGGDAEATVRLAVGRMRCQLCARKVTATLAAVAGVRGVLVTPGRGEILVHFDPQRTAPGRLNDALEAHGFTAEPIASPVPSQGRSDE